MAAVLLLAERTGRPSTLVRSVRLTVAPAWRRRVSRFSFLRRPSRQWLSRLKPAGSRPTRSRALCGAATLLVFVPSEPDPDSQPRKNQPMFLQGIAFGEGPERLASPDGGRAGAPESSKFYARLIVRFWKGTSTSRGGKPPWPFFCRLRSRTGAKPPQIRFFE
jgi:hypothetical protein